MEWLESIRKAIDCMEEHLLEGSGTEHLTENVYLSPLYLQKGFKVLVGFTPSEYVRYRRLYLAALEVLQDKDKIIDIAFKYGYETPESFTKAFTRFHGLSPAQLRKSPSRIKVFLPVTLSIQIQGGNGMDFTVEEMDSITVIGFKRCFSMENNYSEIPKFWQEVYQEHVIPFFGRPEWPQGEIQKAIATNAIGEYGACTEARGMKDFDYMIAGIYKGGSVPSCMELHEIPAATWAKFRCSGPLPGALQSVNRKIFQEWLPGNPDWEIAGDFNIEWYSMEGKNTDADYESAIWIPVRRKH